MPEPQTINTEVEPDPLAGLVGSAAAYTFLFDASVRRVVGDMLIGQARAITPGAIRSAMTAAGVAASERELEALVGALPLIVLHINWYATLRDLVAEAKKENS